MKYYSWSIADYKKYPQLDGLIYRSKLLSSNTKVIISKSSVKRYEKDLLRRDLHVLWAAVDGMSFPANRAKTFAGVKLDEICLLEDQEELSVSQLIKHISYSGFDPHSPELPIDALIHAFIPFAHVDQICSASINTLASSLSGKNFCNEIWQDQFIWVETAFPGLELIKAIANQIKLKPAAKLAVIANHGLLTWGETSQACYENTTQAINQAEEFIKEKNKNRKSIMTGDNIQGVSNSERETILSELLPWLRGKLTHLEPKIIKVDDSEEILSFLNSQQADELLGMSPLIAFQLNSVKPIPLFIDWLPGDGIDKLQQLLITGIEEYQKVVIEHCKSIQDFEDGHVDYLPDVIQIPGIGLIVRGEDAQQAEFSLKMLRTTIEILTKGVGLGGFVGLDLQKAINYWYQYQLITPSRVVKGEFIGQVALITGAASGIGRATAIRLASEGAHVVILDLNMDEAQKVAEYINETYGANKAFAFKCDVGNEEAVQQAFRNAVFLFGGIDIVVNNAGIFLGAPIEDTSLKNWELVQKVLTTGYFLVSREAFRIWRRQKMGGNLVIVGSKNSVRAGKGVVAYSSAKAAELHMARCLAEEGGEVGIRVNSVLPDAVLQGAKIFTDKVRKARADSYGIKPEDLEEYYIQRSTLKVPVYPEHVAEAIAFLASSRSSRTTGGVITVDAGVSTAYMR